MDIPPSIVLAILPEAEREDAQRAKDALLDVYQYVKRFGSALALFNHVEYMLAQARATMPGTDLRKFQITMTAGPWQLIAARDGAMTIYHLSWMLKALRTSARKCPTLSSLVDWSEMRAAGEVFATSFPSWYELRQAVAHSAEIAIAGEANLEIHGPVEIEGMSIGEGVTAILTWQDNLSDRTYSGVRKGKLFSYEISETTLGQLHLVGRHVYAAFQPVQDKAREVALRGLSGEQ